MKKVKALLDFIQLSVVTKIAFYRSVLAHLTGNETFPTPDVPLAEVKTAIDALDTAYQASLDGSHTAVSAMHDAEDKADALFRTLVAYVNRIADGNETQILSSGFHVSKQPGTVQKPELDAQNGDNSGSVWLVARAVDKAGAYIWQMAKDGIPATDEGWTTIGHSTQSYYQLTGLTPGGKYYFRVVAITPTGQSDYTAPVAKIVV
ncbi:MAG TPA: fibronectin type III domain-containing protein [Paludibacter sp.]